MARIFFAQYCNPSESEIGSEAEARVSHRERASWRAEGSERPTLVEGGKMRSWKTKAEETVPKTGPPKGRTKN